ncbi:MAG: GatB/YqeY domain-containing protein, partial [Ilumatobacteraceae bacterium]|nr:GatB/YqeY domain-containing protein [Ilumatobacteraceae bacterium]
MSNLKDQLKSDLTNAMKARSEVETSTLRMTLAAIMNAEVAGDQAVELTNDQVLVVVIAEAKKRAESADIYKEA